MSKAIAVLGVVAGLGVAALPLSSYAVSKTANTTAQAVVGDSIAITIDDATVTMNNVVANEDVNEQSTNVKIQTNATNGYQVQIKDTDGTDLALKPASGATGTAAGIAAGVPAKGTNAWGYKANATDTDITVLTSDYTAITGSNKKIAEKSGPSATAGDTIQLTFGVTVDTTIAAGTYANEVTLTASTL